VSPRAPSTAFSDAVERTSAARIRVRSALGSRAARRWLVVVAVLGVLSAEQPVLGQGAPRISASEQAFIQGHWRRPLAPQGKAPAHFSPVERSLAPADCGTCHPLQLADWRSSLHARSMGPGITGQLVEMIKSDPPSARSCFTCHAPLAEQAPLIRSGTGLVSNPDLDGALQLQGVVCASCHVRRHQRFGPPRRDGTTARSRPREALPHNGVTRTTAFLRSEFCASCHQFAPGGLALNGKLLENTFEEWRASPAARQGRQCQDCHMPDRRHTWRGIHDPDMVKSGLRIELAIRRPPGGEVRATVRIANTGVGHAFPTYVTPRVLVRAELVDGSGDPVPGSREERAIGRDVTLDLSREIADTRIPPGGRFSFTYARRLDGGGLRLSVRVIVYPDHFYTGFFEALLQGGAGAGEAQIREALEATRRSAFVIYERDIPLT
jgi:hypothetical protein